MNAPPRPAVWTPREGAAVQPSLRPARWRGRRRPTPYSVVLASATLIGWSLVIAAGALVFVAGPW